VEVGDGHDAIDVRPEIGDVGGGGETEEEDDGQEQEKKTASGSALSVAGHLNPLRSISFIADFAEGINPFDPFAAAKPGLSRRREKCGSGLTPKKPQSSWG
jgi:hypothetical protein